MPGPPPKENAIRRNARVGPLLLPAAGRPGEPPAWPLPRAQNVDEEVAWARLWATPQAVAWENLGWTSVVARYCRLMVESDGAEAAVTLLSEVRQLEDRLGLNPLSMRRLMWQIAPDEVAEKRDERAPDVRSRLRAVDSA
jgi:hypothetical protein